MQGFSERNLGYMLRFAREYGPPPILQQAAAKLPWSHHLVLMEKVNNLADRLWYTRAAVEHGWSRSVLTVQIEQRAHARAGRRAVTNFAATLPPLQSDLAQQTFKYPYVFDFLTLGPGARERDREQGVSSMPLFAPPKHDRQRRRQPSAVR